MSDQDTQQDDEQDTQKDTEGAEQPGADPEDEQEIEQDREERLDPDNRPDQAEIDNSEREFDATKGMFKDSEGYDEAEPKFPDIGEQEA